MKLHALTVWAALVAAGIGCGPAVGDEKSESGNPSAAQAQPKDIMAKLAKLEGDWRLLGENGEENGVIGSRFRVTPAGMSMMVLEEMFPDSPDGHESINVYQIEDGQVIMTHYCAAASQPRAQVRSTGEDNRLELIFVGATKQPSPDTSQMRPAEYIFHGDVNWGEYTLHGEDRLTTRWGSATDGELSEDNPVAFELKRAN